MFLRRTGLHFILYCLILCAPILLSGQSRDNYLIEESFNNSIGFKVSYDYINYDFKAFENSNRINFSSGLIYKRRLTSNLEFNIGILYSEKGYSQEIIFNADSPIAISFTEYLISAAYLDIPLNIGYRYIVNRKLVIVPGGGFILSTLLSKSVSSEDIEVDAFLEEFLTSEIAGPLFALNVGIGIEWHFQENYFLSFEPYFRNWFSNMNESVINSAPTSYGVGISFNKKF